MVNEYVVYSMIDIFTIYILNMVNIAIILH